MITASTPIPAVRSSKVFSNPGEERSQGLAMAVFDRMAYWKKAYASAECTGLETVNDKPCYKVILAPRAFGEKESKKTVHTAYFEKESGLLVRFDMEARTAMGALPMQSLISDYQEADGVLIPRRWSSR